ncbi:MAG TPA: hypothetical protein VNQ79_26410 [Blastocatellia bacterium]|nr:hypothetical protein [Blastocatellia bacterium]
MPVPRQPSFGQNDADNSVEISDAVNETVPPTGADSAATARRGRSRIEG